MGSGKSLIFEEGGITRLLVIILITLPAEMKRGPQNILTKINYLNKGA
jgi:hypothetical protein